MPPRFPAILLALLVACHAGAAPTVPAPESGSTERTLLAAMQVSAAAWNRGDIAGHVAMYTDSAKMMFRAGPRGGREFIRGSLERNFWKDGLPLQQLSFSDLVVTPLGRDYAMLTGAFLLSGGNLPDASGRFTLVWQRTAAGWRIIHDHSS